MTSTRDKAVNIFQNLIRDPYYQGSKDKSREEVVWIEAEQRARQAHNNEIALSMAISKSPLSSVANFMNFMLLMKATELSFNPQEEADFLNNPDISDEIKDLYATAKHPSISGRPIPGHAAAKRTLLDEVRKNPDSPIPTKEVEDKPEEVKPTPPPPVRAQRETAEQKRYREQLAESQSRSARTTEQQRAALHTAVETAAEARKKTTEREERQLPQVPSHRTTEGRAISKGFHEINPAVFMPEEDAAEMQKYTRHYAIPVEEMEYGQLPYGGEKTYVPMLILNDLTTIGHTRFPFESFINKFRNDSNRIGQNLSDYVNGTSILEHLWQHDQPANNAVFHHYLDELAGRTVGDHAVEGSEIEGPLQDVHSKMRTYRESVNYWKAQRTPNQRTRNDARDDLVKSLSEYNEAISSLENAMEENPHLNIPKDDRAGFRQQVLDSEHSAELSRLWFIEAYSTALGYGGFSDAPPFTPFSDFMERFRFSPEELTDKEREDTRDKDGNLQLNNAVHWGVNSSDKVQDLLNNVLSSYLDKLPDNFLNHPDYGILDEDGNVKDIEAWQPHPTAGTVDKAGNHVPLSWYETLEKYLDGNRAVVTQKKAVARNRPKIKTDVGRTRTRIRQILNAGEEAKNTPGMDDTTGIEEFGSEPKSLKQILNPETEDVLRDTVSEHLLDDNQNFRNIETLEDYEEHIRKTMMENIPVSLANPDSLIGRILGSVPMGRLGFTFGSAMRDFEPQNFTWLYPAPPTKGTPGEREGKDRFRTLPDTWDTIFTRISKKLEEMATPEFESDIPPEQQIATGVGKFNVTFDGKRYYADVPLPQDITTPEEYMDEENGFLAQIAKQLGAAKIWTTKKKATKDEWSRNVTYTEEEPEVEISDAPEEDLGEAQEGDEVEPTSSMQNWLNNWTEGQTGMAAEDESLTDAILAGSEQAEEVDAAVRDKVRENAPAFINALASDDDLKYLVGDGKTFSLNSETNTVSSRIGKFDAESAEVLSKINDLIDSHLMPKDEDGIPLITYFGQAVEVPFSISRGGKPTTKSIRQAAREKFIEEYDNKYGVIPELTDDMSQEQEDKIDEMHEGRQDKIEEHVKWLDNIAPGTMSKYIDLIHGMGEYAQTHGMGVFYRDVLEPLREEATRETPLGQYVLPNGEFVDSLSELPGVGEGASDEEKDAYRRIRTNRDEEVNDSRGVYFANKVLSNQDSLPFSEELANDIATEFVHPWNEMARLRADSGKMMLAPEDFSEKQTFENFRKVLSQMILPTGQSTATKRRELDNLLHSFAINLVQSLTAADYREAEGQAGEPDFDWGIYPLGHEQAGEAVPTPPEILGDILKELNNPMNGLLPFKKATPSISNLLQPTTRAGGVAEWTADNAMAIEFFQNLLGPSIFNSWDGLRRAKAIFGKISALTGSPKVADEFAPNINGEIPPRAFEHLYSVLMLPTTAEEWENPDTIETAERWLPRPGQKGTTNPWRHQLGRGFSKVAQQKIIQHFFANHHPDFMDAPFALSSIQSENDPIGQEYQRMREIIGDMAFGELGARQAFEMEPIEYKEGTRDVPIENLRDLVTEEFASIQLAMPFAASSQPIGKNSPSMLDDYVRKVLSLLKGKESEILETGEGHPLYRLAVPAPTSDNQEGDLARRIRSIEDAYIHAEGDESLRNQFFQNYWDAWLADPSQKAPNLEFPADPSRDEISEAQQHIHDMWSDKPLPYELSSTVNTFFSMAKLLDDRGWRKQIEDHQREGHLLPEGEEETHLTKDQQDFLSESVMNVVNGFKQNADAINTTDPEERPDPEQQFLQAQELFKHPEDTQEYRPGTPNMAELGEIARRHALQTLPEDETAADPADFSFARFNELFPNKLDEEDESIPPEVIEWLKSETDYTPLAEGGDGIRHKEDGAIIQKKPWLHPEADGIPGSPNYLKPHPDEGEKLSAAKRKLLQSKNWVARPHTPITGADGAREMHDVLLPYVKATEDAAKQAAEETRPYRTDTSSDPTVSGSASHKDLYEHLRTNSSRERGSFLSHDEYDNTIHPYLGRDVKQYFEDAGMLHTDDRGIPSFNPNPPTPGQMSAKEYMDSLPRSQGRGMFHTEEGGGGTIPQQWVQPMVDGYKNGLRPMAPTPEGNGEDLLKSLDVLLKSANPIGGSDSGPAATGNNLINRHHPGIDADWYNHDIIKSMFADVADGDGKFVHDPALLQAWMDTHRPPLHHSSQPGQPLVEMPYKPQIKTSGPSDRMTIGNFKRNVWRDTHEGGSVDGKKGMLGTLYNSITKFEKARTRANIKGSPQRLRDLDYQTYINQQWVRILEDQLLRHHAQSSGDVIDLEDDDQRNEILGNMSIADRTFYENSLSREENLFKGHLQRWAVEHNVPEDSINHDAMRNFLSDSAQWGNNPIHWVEQKPNGQEVRRFNPHRMSSPPIQKLMHQHFIDNHPDYFTDTSPAKDFDAREQEFHDIIKPTPTPTATIDSPEQPAGTPIDPGVDEYGNPIVPPPDPVTIADTPSGPVNTSTGALDPSGPSIVTSQSPRVTAAKTAQAGQAAKAPAESRFKQGGLAWNKIAIHLGENSDMTPQEVIAYMHQMDDGELKSHWQAHVKERQERSKPTPEAPAGLDDAKRKDYISSIIAHSHEMHGLNIHDNNKFAEMNDKQLTDAYHKAHADVSAHRAKVSGESKQQYANDIVTRLAPLADDAQEDKILNQARSLMSEYLKHRSIFDKPALSHWQTLMNDMRGKAEQAGIDWEGQMNTELTQHWENFGSPKHLEEVNRVKQEQQQKQQDYEAGLDKKFADAQQHPEYRPGRFINFSQSQQAMGGQQAPPTPRGHDYDRPFDFGVSRQDLDELGGEQPPVFEDARGRQAYGMYHPHSQSWINPFVYEQARTNMKQKNQNPHLTTTSVIRNGRQWTNTHQYEDNQEIDPKHSFAIPSQKKQAELEQNNMSQMGYMLGTDGNIVGLDSDWQSVLTNRDMGQDHPPHRVISDWYIRNLQQQHDQNPEYIGTRREASMVTPKSQQAQQAQAQSQQPPKQPGTALERFTNRRTGLSTEAKKYSYNPQDFMSEWEQAQFSYNQFFDDKGGIVRGIGRALTLKNPFTQEQGLMDYWKDRTKEYESQNKVQELYQRMHQQYYGSAPPKPFYGSSEWAKKRAETEMAGHDTSGAGQSEYGPPPDQFQEQPQQPQQQGQQTQPVYQEFEQPKEIKLPRPWLNDYSYQV